MSLNNNQPEPNTQLLPYTDASSARDAVRCFSRPKTERDEILLVHSRLQLCPPDMVQNITKSLLDNFEHLLQDAQEVAFALVENVFRQSAEISRLILPLALLVNCREEHIQNRAIDLICSVGPLAKPAEDLSMGCLRNSDPIIRMAGARILYAIGAACSRSITRQLRAVAQRYTTDREFCALLLATVRRITDVPVAAGASSPAATAGSPAQPATAGSESSESSRNNITDVLCKLLEGRTLLVIDDNDALRYSISEMLGERLGMRVLQAENGRKGLAFVKECAQRDITIDYITLDLKLPDVNGIQVLKLLRELPHTAEVPVVIMSTIADERILTTLNELDIVAYLRKPFRMNQLIRALVASHSTRAPA